MTTPPGAGDLDEALERAEQTVARRVDDLLEEVARLFAHEVQLATRLTAATFSVTRIAAMWTKRVPRLLARLLSVAETAAQHTARSVDADLPPEWDNLPDRTEDPDRLPDGLGDYVTVTEHLLAAVGDQLAEAARRELAAGLDAGETIAQLKARLRTAFDRDGAQLGSGRAERIAQTEACRAWNTATLAAARALTGPERPLVKQWLTRRDPAVRDAHARVNGQLRLLDEPFRVAGVAMDTPGDPTAPPELVINCRCVLAVAHAGNTAAATRTNPAQTAPFDVHTTTATRAAVSGPTGKGHMVLPEPVTAAADGSHRQGAMIALVPREEDAARLAIEGGEPADELHLTLYFLGDDSTAWDQDQQRELIAGVRARAAALPGPVHATAFGANHWNPASDSPAWVWSVGDNRDRPEDAASLLDAHNLATAALEDTHERPDIPEQHSPWAAHVTAAYSDDPGLLAHLEERLGPIVFDRIRLAFADQSTDVPLGPERPQPATANTSARVMPRPRRWSTPGDAAIAFESVETGDGRIFSPDALYWTNGPWPLQYADEMLAGHEGAELAGAIQHIARDGGRIPASGVLYPSRPAGADVVTLLEEGAPLGVSVDLDDIDVQFIDRTPTTEEQQDGEKVLLAASLPQMSVLRLHDGAWMVRATAASEWTASGRVLLRNHRAVEWTTGPDGAMPAAGLQAALSRAGITAAAGDADDPTRGEVVHSQSSGDLLMRITRGRVRGATLVSMPAFDQARIVLDPADEHDDTTTTAATAPPPEPVVAAGGEVLQRVVTYVTSAPAPVGAREVAAALGITMTTARGHLSRAAAKGLIVRIARGLYVGAPTLPESGEVTAALSGNLELPVHPDRDAQWDGDKAASRVLAWATGEAGEVDADRLGRAFLYRDPDADPATLAAYKLGFADVVTRDGTERLEIIARGVFAVAGVLEGAMGGVDVPQDERDGLRERVEELYERLADAYNDPSLRAPWDTDNDDSNDNDGDDGEGMRELEASAWAAVQDLDPMPAAWFKEPTVEELPAGSGGVHYRAGRIYGWVAQAGEPHAGFPGKNLTLESLGEIDLTHFLRARFPLDDGTLVKAGAITMNVGHHRDGAECETAACQWDDTRTVAGIVTVGLNDRGMWFSGAAAPWLDTWDAQVFRACQPSYHMRQGRDGRWQLRAVLSVPVPGHSSPLLATFAAQSNLALAASAVSATTTTALQAAADLTADSGGSISSLAESLTTLIGRVTNLVTAATTAVQQPAPLPARSEIEALAARIAPTSVELVASTHPEGR